MTHKSPTWEQSRPVDIAILTIREDEFRAVLNVFPNERKLLRGRRHYNLRTVDAGGGKTYRLAIVRQVEQGNGEAQDAARDIIEELKPRLMLVVGIAGGLPSDDFTLGDVIVSTRINDYSVEARKEGHAPSYSMSGGPMAREIAAGVANLAAMDEALGDWTNCLSERPNVDIDAPQTYGPAEWQSLVHEKLRVHFGQSKTRPPLVTAGTIATSDRLVKDPNVLFPWIETARHILAVEMESGGVYRAARERTLMIAIRAISDIVGLNRDERWTKFACCSAAAFTKAYLRTTPIPATELDHAKNLRQSSPGGVTPPDLFLTVDVVDMPHMWKGDVKPTRVRDPLVRVQNDGSMATVKMIPRFKIFDDKDEVVFDFAENWKIKGKSAEVLPNKFLAHSMFQIIVGGPMRNWVAMWGVDTVLDRKWRILGYWDYSVSGSRKKWRTQTLDFEWEWHRPELFAEDIAIKIYKQATYRPVRGRMQIT